MGEARPGGRRAVRTASAVLVGALAVTGYGVADAYDVVPGLVTLAPAATDVIPTMPGSATTPGSVSTTESSTSTASKPSTPTTPALPTATLSGLIGLEPSARRPTTTGLARVLAPLARATALGTRVGVDVRDGLTGARLYAVGPDRAQAPASTAKLLTAAAIASSADLAATRSTRVVTGTTVGEIVLVAGGDTLLADGAGNPDAVAGHAGLADLAAATAAALKAPARGTPTTSVRLSLDDTLARGPAYPSTWKPEDIAHGLTGPVAMLGTLGQRAKGGHPAVPDPAAGTAALLRAALIARGITVAPTIARRAAPSTAVELAHVDSAPAGEVLSYALDHSDNPLTESLARYAAVTDSSSSSRATFPAVSAWVRTRLAGLGLDLRGMTLVDACGLSLGAGVPARVLADVLTLATAGTSTAPGARAFAAIVARLPVAAVSGTLGARFRSASGHAGAGRVRAKTGTLTGVSSLAGTVVDADGRLLVFAVLADAVPVGGTSRAREALDVLAAGVASCGCQ